MSNDLLELRLRAMLHERADDIERVPAWAVADIDSDDASFPLSRAGRTDRWRPVMTVAAVAAVVLAVVGLAVVLARRHTSGTSPASPRTDTVRTCTVSLTTPWRQARESTQLGGEHVQPLALTPNGYAVVMDRTGYGTFIELRRGAAVRTIYSLPAQNYVVSTASTDGRWVVLPVSYLPESGNANALATVVRVVRVDLRPATASVAVIAQVPATGPATIDNAVLFDGSVYWDVRPSYGQSAGSVVQRFDLATGKTSVAYRGSVVWLDLTAIGVSVSGEPTLAPTIPAAVPEPVRGLLGSRPNGAAVATDGTSWAWLGAGDRLYWWRPGTAVRVTAAPADLSGLVLHLGDLAVAGSYVVLDGRVVDMLTGAETTLPTGDIVFAASNGRLLVRRTQEIPSGPYLLDTAALPPLTC